MRYVISSLKEHWVSGILLISDYVHITKTKIIDIFLNLQYL